MYTARDIANWFLAWGYTIEDAEISNLKLQKNLYYAQGYYLAETGEKLFPEQFEAWAHGPVIPEIYRSFKTYGSGTINAETEVPETFNWDDFKDVENYLIKVWNTYGSLDAWKLRNMTHEESPWRDTFNSNSRSTIIDDSKMADYFIK